MPRNYRADHVGNLLTEEQQWRKPELVAEVARHAWGD